MTPSKQKGTLGVISKSTGPILASNGAFNLFFSTPFSFLDGILKDNPRLTRVTSSFIERSDGQKKGVNAN
jgi:hypothetical protein